MPYRPKTPCHHPGCPELVEAGRLYCEKHLPLHPEATRPAAKRGYNRRWQKARKSYLEAIRCVCSVPSRVSMSGQRSWITSFHTVVTRNFSGTKIIGRLSARTVTIRRR